METAVQNNKYSKLTFAQFKEIWQTNWLDKRDITLRVREDYIGILKRYIEPFLADKRIAEISAFDIDEIVDCMAKQGYSSKTIRNTFVVINSVFSYAFRKGFIKENPCIRCDDLPPIKSKESIHYFSEEQARLFLFQLEREDLTYRTFYTLALFGGFRRGELCALCWSDIDFDNRCISITKSMTHVNGKEFIKPPKTRSGYRIVVLPDFCFELLKELKKENRNSSFVFLKKRTEEPLSLQQATNEFARILGNCPELPKIRLHDLRHTSATLLLAYGTDIETVAHRLGHSKPSVTIDIYGHAIKSMDYKAAETLDTLLLQQAM